MNKIKSEPVIAGATIAALVGAVFVLLESFGVNLTPDQQTAITSLVVVIVPLVIGFVVRRYTTGWNANNPLVNYEKQLPE